MAENTQMPDLGGDTPPKTRRGRPRGSGGSGAPRKGDVGAKIVEGFTGLYMLIGACILPFNQYDGAVFMEKAVPMAKTLEQVGRRNRDVYKWLARVSDANDFTAVFMSYGAVAVAISANHGLLPPRAVDAFELPRPPEREAAPAESPYPSPEKYSEGIVDNASGQYVPAWEPVPEQPVPTMPNGEVPQGLHVNADIVATLRAEALRHAMEQAGLAAQRGEEGLPNPNTNPRGALGG